MTESSLEQVLLDRGKNFSSIIQDHEDGYYEIDLEGNFLFFNRAILSMSGYTGEELLCKNSIGLVALQHLADVRRLFRNVLDNGAATQYVEINFNKKDGSTLFVKMTAAIVTGPDGKATGFHGFVRDITERRKYEEMQRQTQRQLDAINETLENAVADANVKAVEAEVANIELNQIFNTSLDGMWILDLKRNIIRVNDTMGAMLGMTADQVVGHKCYEILAGHCCDKQMCTVRRIKKKKVPVLMDIELPTRGTLTPYSLTATPFYGIESELVGVLENFRDITEQKEAEKTLQKAHDKLKRLAARDGLTDIANRRSLDDCLDREWRRLTREKGPLAFILCDVDFFKKYNDTYGHQKGDDCLRFIARALEKSARRPADFVARYGGEEFAVILPNTGLEGAVCVAQNIRQAVMDLKIEHCCSAAAPVVTLSLGAACAQPVAGRSAEPLVAAADRALYNAKAAGRNRVFALAVGLESEVR